MPDVAPVIRMTWLGGRGALVEMRRGKGRVD